MPGAENILSGALSQLYSFDQPGTVQARSEYTYHDVVDNNGLDQHLTSMPLLVGVVGENAALPKASVEPILEGMSSQSDMLKSHCGCCRAVVELAETGCPETSCEFAARTTHHFMLHGP